MTKRLIRRFMYLVIKKFKSLFCRHTYYLHCTSSSPKKDILYYQFFICTKCGKTTVIKYDVEWQEKEGCSYETI